MIGLRGEDMVKQSGNGLRFLVWYCHKCGRKVAEVNLAAGDRSMVELACPRCRERNVYDFDWYHEPKYQAKTCSQSPKLS